MDGGVQAVWHLLSLTLKIKDDPVQDFLLPLDLFAYCWVKVYAALLRLTYSFIHLLFGFLQTFQLFLDAWILAVQLFRVIQTVSNFLL